MKEYVKSMAITIKDLGMEHFADWVIHIAEGLDKFPFWGGLTICVWIIYISLIVSSWFHPGKVLDWVDKQ